MMVRYVPLLAVAVIASQATHGSALRGSSTESKEVRELQDIRIVGGQPASLDDFPFFVNLLGCGASLVWEDVVLTAAHCNLNLTDCLVGPDEVNRTVVWGTVHPSYAEFMINTTDTIDFEFVEFDFMVLALDNPVEGVPLVELNSEDEKPANGSQLQLIGFGATAENGAGSDELLKVTLDYIDNSECNDLYEGFISDSMMCAGVEGGGKDGCQGDSGGPLFVGSVQYGVVSFGDGCGRADKPGVYARVSAVYDWIQMMICCLSANPPTDCGIVDESACPNNLVYGSDEDGDVLGNFTGGGIITDDDDSGNA